MKYYMGIDQSFSNTGIAIIDENDNIVLSTSIPTSPELLKMFELYPFDVMHELDELQKLGLLVGNKLTKAKKDLTKKDKELLKIDSTLRFNIICDQLLKVLDENHNLSAKNILVGSDLSSEIVGCGIETISFGSKGNTADLGSLLGAIQRTLYLNNIKIHKFEPKRVKKFAGNGTFDKDEMFNALSDEEKSYLTQNCPMNTKDNYVGLDDRVDALWIAKMTKEESFK